MSDDDGRPDSDAEIRRELEGIPREKRRRFLAALPREQWLRFMRVLPLQDRKSVEAERQTLAGARVEGDRTARLQWAREGRAESVADIVDLLLEDRHVLSPNGLAWVARIDSTAAGFHSYSGFTDRQAEVIRGIYVRHFGKSSRQEYPDQAPEISIETHCYKCSRHLDTKDCFRCGHCGRIKCPTCGACYCDR